MAIADHLKTMMCNDLRVAMADAPGVLIFGDRSVAGTVSPINSGDDPDPEGIIAQADVVFIAPNEDFGKKLPEVRDVVEVDGSKYWVARVENDGAVVTLWLRRG